MNNPDWIKFLLNRFNDKDMDWDKKRIEGSGKLGKDKDIKEQLDKNYFAKLLEHFNL
jgi:hypothetical protein